TASMPPVRWSSLWDPETFSPFPSHVLRPFSYFDRSFVHHQNGEKLWGFLSPSSGCRGSQRLDLLPPSDQACSHRSASNQTFRPSGAQIEHHPSPDREPDS